MLWIFWFFAGVASWSFSEYAIHRWLFHGPRKKHSYNAEHLEHHARQHYFAPNWKKVALATGAGTAIGVPAGLLFGASGLSFVAGFVFFYGVYELVHRRCHTHPPRGAYSRLIRRHHFHHHYAAPTKNHGVTSPLWDVVFRTYERPNAPLTVPERQIMDWLCDPETGEVAEAFAGDYRIHWRRSTERARKLAA